MRSKVQHTLPLWAPQGAKANSCTACSNYKHQNPSQCHAVHEVRAEQPPFRGQLATPSMSELDMCKYVFLTSGGEAVGGHVSSSEDGSVAVLLYTYICVYVHWASLTAVFPGF